MSLLRVPGLYFFKNFLPEQLHLATLNHIRDTQDKVRLAAREAADIKTRTYLSRQHNLQSAEYYRNVAVTPLGETRRLSMQYFNTYGNKGHELTYGIGRSNISDFVLSKIIPLMEPLPPVAALQHNLPEGKAAELRLTINFYNPIQEDPKELPGFEWHKDATNNGDITAIYTLFGDSVDFEIKEEEHPERICSLSVAERSLVILSGDARWKWIHRIVPKVFDDPIGAKRERVSLAFGFKV